MDLIERWETNESSIKRIKSFGAAWNTANFRHDDSSPKHSVVGKRFNPNRFKDEIRRLQYLRLVNQILVGFFIEKRE